MHQVKKSPIQSVIYSTVLLILVLWTLRYFARNYGGWYSPNYILNDMFNNNSIFTVLGYSLAVVSYILELVIAFNVLGVSNGSHRLTRHIRNFASILTGCIVTYGIVWIFLGRAEF